MQQGLSKIYERTDSPSFLESHDKGLLIYMKEETSRIEFPVFLFTNLGMQVMDLCQAQSNENYLREVGKHIKTLGVDVTLCSTLRKDKGRLNYKTIAQL